MILLEIYVTFFVAAGAFFLIYRYLNLIIDQLPDLALTISSLLR